MLVLFFLAVVAFGIEAIQTDNHAEGDNREERHETLNREKRTFIRFRFG